jgi:hypothetical protein
MFFGSDLYCTFKAFNNISNYEKDGLIFNLEAFILPYNSTAISTALPLLESNKTDFTN